MINKNSGNKLAAWSFLPLSLLIFIGGALIGLLVFGVSRLIYIVIIFPFFMGIAGGVIAEKLITKYKMTKPEIGLIIGLITGLIIYSTFYFAGYQLFKVEASNMLKDELMTAYGSVDHEIIDLMLNEFLSEETGHTGIQGYIALKAKTGVSIGQISGIHYFTLGPVLSYIYWIIELIIIGGFAALGGKKAASRPFCETCSDWYGKEEHIGAVHLNQSQELLNSLHSKDYILLGGMLKEDVSIPSFDVYLQVCSKCQTSNSRLVVRRSALNKKGKVQFEPIFNTTLAPEQTSDFLKAIRFAR